MSLDDLVGKFGYEGSSSLSLYPKVDGTLMRSLKTWSLRWEPTFQPKKKKGCWEGTYLWPMDVNLAKQDKQIMGHGSESHSLILPPYCLYPQWAYEFMVSCVIGYKRC